MSDTAETDMVVAADTGDSGFIRNLVQLARKLERERDEARRELAEFRKNSLALVEELKKSVIRLAKERDEALESLSNVRRELSRLIYGESIGTQLAIEDLEILAKRKEEE